MAFCFLFFGIPMNKRVYYLVELSVYLKCKNFKEFFILFYDFANNPGIVVCLLLLIASSPTHISIRTIAKTELFAICPFYAHYYYYYIILPFFYLVRHSIFIASNNELNKPEHNIKIVNGWFPWHYYYLRNDDKLCKFIASVFGFGSRFCSFVGEEKEEYIISIHSAVVNCRA